MGRSHGILVTATALVVAACSPGGGDPTAPRDVRTIETEPAPASVASERDAAAPSRGLPCDVQLDRDDPPALGLCGAATDNYKASYNDDPDAIELRTWLAIHQLQLDGERWQPVAGTPLTAAKVVLERADGAPGTRTVTVSVVDGPGANVVVRTGPQHGLWGPLLTIDSRAALEDAPVTVRIDVDGDGDAGRSVQVLYRRDDQLADAPPDSLEHNGPGGRWVVAGMKTATNVELGWE